MDEAEEVAPVIPTKAEGQTGEKQAERYAEVAEEELNEQRGRKWRMPEGCSEHRPQQTQIRFAGEVLTSVPGAALESEQIGKVMEAMGIAQNLKGEEDVAVARGEGSKFVQFGLAQAARQRILAGISETKVRYLGSRLTWTMAFAAENAVGINAVWNARHLMEQFCTNVICSAATISYLVQHHLTLRSVSFFAHPPA